MRRSLAEGFLEKKVRNKRGQKIPVDRPCGLCLSPTPQPEKVATEGFLPLRDSRFVLLSERREGRRESFCGFAF